MQTASFVGGVALAGGIGVAGYHWTSSANKGKYGGIACRDVLPRLADYAAGRLSPELSEKIDMHLAQCRFCRMEYEKLA